MMERFWALPIFAIAVFWFWMAYSAWKKHAWWNRMKMKWVRKPRSSKSHSFDVMFDVYSFAAMGAMVTFGGIICAIRG
jgi:hypothetical protein